MSKIKHARIFIRVTSEKHSEIRFAATALGLTISAYLLALHEGAQTSTHLEVQGKQTVIRQVRKPLRT